MADISQIKLPSGDTFDIIDEKSGYIKTSIYHGTSASEAADTTKVVTCENFTSSDLKAGAAILVTFSTTNSAAVASLALNVNGTGVKNVKYINNGTLGNLSSAGYLKANTTYLFIYDGTYWVAYFNYNTTYSLMSEAEARAGTATTARTVSAVRLKDTIDYTLENKTDYSIPVSRVGEIVVGETAIGTDSTNFPTSKAVVDYVDERVVQEMEAIDVGVTGIKADGKSLSVVNGVVNIPVISSSQSVGLMTQDVLDTFANYIQSSIPTSTSQLTNDSGFISSYTETDPVFSASAAAGITSTDISNWNNMVPITNGSMFINNDGNNNGFIVEYGETNIIQVTYNQTNQNNETHIHYVVTPVANGDAANKKYVDDSISAISIPTKTSDLTNDSNFTAKSTITATLTTTWSSKTQTVSVTGVTASNTVIITPAPASYNAYCEYGVYCSAQSSGTLTFTCDEVPTSSLTVNVLILN